MTAATDLTAFLAARLDEDEAWAQLARSTTEQNHPDWRDDHGDVFEAGGPRIAHSRSANVAPHIARHDPARVLREVDAKRKIVAVHAPLPSAYGEEPCCSACWPQPRIGTHPLWPCSTVRSIAAVYSDHPDYDPAWGRTEP